MGGQVQECPACRRLSTPDALRCDCGFRFGPAAPVIPPATGTIATPVTAKPVQGRWNRIWWPNVDDEKSARDAIRSAMWVATAQAVFTAVAATFGVLGFRTSSWLDVLWLAALTWGLWHQSRVAALVSLASYWVGRFVNAAPAKPSLVLILIFTLAYLNGVRGAFSYHKLIGSRVVWSRVIVGGIIAVVLALTTLFGLVRTGLLAGIHDKELQGTLRLGIALGVGFVPMLTIPIVWGSFVSKADNPAAPPAKIVD